MIGGLETRVLRLLRVPPEPAPHPGDTGQLRVFRAAPAYFRYRLLGWGLGQLGALAGLVIGLVILGGIIDDHVSGLPRTLLTAAEAFAWLAFFAQLPLGLAALRLDYELRWYVLSDRSLRIREGVFTVREKTITYANIQQIGVRQGPLQRVIGVADLEVRTAGGGGSSQEGEGGDMHRGLLRGVAEPEILRDVIRERMLRQRDAGLGDPDDVGPAGIESPSSVAPPVPEPEGPATPTAEAPAAVAGELLREVRALRRVLTPPDPGPDASA